MTDLREQLLRAGLVTEAQAEKAAETTDNRRDGQGGGGAGGHGRRRRGGRGGGNTQAKERVEATPYRTDEPSEDERKQAHKLATSARQDQNALRGGKRWYYVARNDEVPFVEVNDDAMERLSKGELAIVESRKGDAWMVAASVANELGQLDPSSIRVWNHG